MANEQLKAVRRDLRTLFGEGTFTGLGDPELLERFVAGRDEAAFAALLAAHGPMVLTVCRRVLSNPSDVEDAFQATFLVLARKARSVRADGSLGSWLHRVAYRVAVEANRDAGRRRAREVTAAVPISTERDDGLLQEDFRPALHEELARLPENFRRPVVLCYLEGKTQEEAAAELRWSGATLRRRLAGARERLRARLIHRGIAPSSALLAAALADDAAAAIPPDLASATTRAASALILGRSAIPYAALTLSRRVLRSLLMTKFKAVTAVLPAAVAIAWVVLAAGVGNVAGRPQGPSKLAAPRQGGQPPVGNAERRIGVATVQSKTVAVIQRYVCQIHSQRHISVQALVSGPLEEIDVKEGQVVKKGDLMFKVASLLHQARLDSESAEVRIAQLELDNTRKLFDKKAVAENEVRLSEAKLAKAKAKAELAKAELGFAIVRAPFGGVVGRLLQQQGAMLKEGDELTSLSDSSVMWVYFNVPAAAYPELKSELERKDSPKIELEPSGGKRFQHPGKIGAIEATFEKQAGNIAFRADFPNPEGSLRHGQTGTMLIHRKVPDAVVIPQRATFEILDKRYVYVVDRDDVAHQRGISVRSEVDDLFVIKEGLVAGDKIVVEGIRSIHDGEKVQR